MQPSVRDLLEKRITEIAQAQAASFGASAEVNYIRRYPVLNNTAEHTEFCKQLVRNWLGDGGLVASAGSPWTWAPRTPSGTSGQRVCWSWWQPNWWIELQASFSHVGCEVRFGLYAITARVVCTQLPATVLPA